MVTILRYVRSLQEKSVPPSFTMLHVLLYIYIYEYSYAGTGRVRLGSDTQIQFVCERKKSKWNLKEGQGWFRKRWRVW